MNSEWIEQARREVRFASRSILRTPGVSAIAVLSLALGIGANTAIFSIVDALLLRAAPVRAPGELYQVARNVGARPAVSWNYPDYRAFRQRSTAFQGLVAYTASQPLGFQTAAAGASSATELAYAAMVSGNYFDVLGVEPAIGHLLNAADDRQFGASPYVVLSHDFWRRRFAADPGVVGRTVRLNGYPFTIVGVARHDFRGLDVAASPNLFLPMTMRTEVNGVPLTIWNTRHYWWFQVVGRKRADAAVSQAEGQLATILKDQEEAEQRADPGGGTANRGQTIRLQSAAHGYSYVRNTLEKPLLVLMVVVAVVLLIACANVAGLMLARAAARQREMAIRLAVGAGRARLVVQLLTESALLALAGGLAGLVFAYLCVRLLLGFLPQFGGLQVNLEVSPDLRLLAFTFVVSLLTGLAFGVAPAWQATRPDVASALRHEGGPAGRPRIALRRLLVVAQVALSLTLLVGAGLFLRTLANLRHVDAGFRATRTTVIGVDPSRNGYKGQRLREFYERLRETAQRIPGVQSASLAFITPLAGSRWNGDVSFEGYTWKAGEQRFMDMNAVGPRYFETVGIPLVLGRDFRDADNPAQSADPPETLRARRDRPPAAGPRVAIVTESVAKHVFAGRNPIGLHVCLQEEYDATRALEIVGVVKDAHYFGLREGTEPIVYVPTWADQVGTRSLCLRAAGQGGPIVEAVRRQVTTLDPAVPVLSARTLQEEIDNNLVVERLVATLSSFFGALALLLAGIGLYGVIAHSTARRTREIGIRMALGAARTSVLWLVMREAALIAGTGTAIGLPAAVALTRLVKAFLYGVAAADSVTLVAGIAVLAVVATAAAILPARRAASIAPGAALRCE